METRKQKAAKHKLAIHMKFRSLIQTKLEQSLSTCETIAAAFDAVENEIKAKPQEKQLFIDAYEKEIEPVCTMLHIKLGL